MVRRPLTETLTTMDQVWDYYRQDLEQVEGKIRTSLVSSVPIINQIIQYIVNSGGKRIRPLLLIIASKLNGEAVSQEEQVILASSVEFIHTATLLHDDVIDEAEVRRGKKAVRQLWGNQASILVGDYLYTQAVSFALTLANHEVNAALADACRLMTEGETLQLQLNGSLEVTEDQYLSIIQKKTAALLSATCRLGGMISGSTPEQQQALADFGMHLGTAYQLADDTLDYIADEDLLGKALGKDLREGKITLPLLHLLSHCEPEERAWINDVVRLDQFAPTDLVKIQERMRHHGSIDYAINKAKESVTLAKKSLDCYPYSLHRQALFVVADYVVSRDH